MSVINELRMRPATAERRSWDASLAVRLGLAVTVISTLLIGANLATPIYPLIQADLGLTPFAVTVAFASYVLALITGLVLAGHWSDHIGRRAALVVAVVLGLLGAALFAVATSLPVLAAGRVLQGAAVALATGASAAALRDLLPSRPEWASRFTLMASAGGVAAGPVIGGLLSLLPAPTRTPFVIYLGVLATLLIPLVLLRARPAVKPAAGDNPLAVLRPRRPAVSAEARRAFWTASSVGFLSFAVFGFTLSLAPTWFADIAGTQSCSGPRPSASCYRRAGASSFRWDSPGWRSVSACSLRPSRPAASRCWSGPAWSPDSDRAWPSGWCSTRCPSASTRRTTRRPSVPCTSSPTWAALFLCSCSALQRASGASPRP
jgi:MFS family permease